MRSIEQQLLDYGTFHEDQQGGVDLEEITAGLASNRRQRFSGPLIAFAAATMVALVIGGVALVSRTEPSVGDPTPTTLIPSVTTIPTTPPSTVAGPPTTVTATTEPQPLVAEPQPACGGADSPVTGSTGEAEDPPPGPPILIPPGPCIGTWTTYTQAHGLPECICDLGVAPDGTVWVLSEFGDIATFDGTAWRTLDTGILNVNALDFTQDGTLWIATNRGVWALEAGEWIQKGDTPGFDIAAAADGSIWVYFDGAIHEFDGSTWSEHPLSGNWRPLEEGVGAETLIDVAPDGTLWLAAGGTLDSYDGTTWTSHSPEGRFTPHAMTVGPDGSVWMASASNPAFGGTNVLQVPGLEQDGYGLVSYDGTSWIAYPIPSHTDIAFGSDGTLWVSDSFIGAFHYDGQEWVHYTEGHGLAASALELVAVAPDGTVWLTTLFGHVVRYQPTP